MAKSGEKKKKKEIRVGSGAKIKTKNSNEIIIVIFDFLDSSLRLYFGLRKINMYFILNSHLRYSAYVYNYLFTNLRYIKYKRSNGIRSKVEDRYRGHYRSFI